MLDPAKTELVTGTSPKFNAALLYLEALRQRTTPNDDNIHLGHRAVMNVLPFQLEPALQDLKQPRTRILIPDAVGLDKTLEVGILASELIQRGCSKPILVVTLKSMLTQFQKEFWSRFSIPWLESTAASTPFTTWTHRIGRPLVMAWIFHSEITSAWPSSCFAEKTR